MQSIKDAINRFCADEGRLAEVDVVTLTAKGEPTLHSEFGEILRYVRQWMKKPIAVLTNGTTLSLPVVRQDLAGADIVVPSLDSARVASFVTIDRPNPELQLEEIIEGLIQFSREYHGKLWLEILLVAGCNDTAEDVQALARVIQAMDVDRIQLNTVVRPPAELTARAVSNERLLEIAQFLRRETENRVDLPFSENTLDPRESEGDNEKDAAPSLSPQIVGAIQEMLQRRPCTAADIDQSFHLGGADKVEQLLEPFVHSGTLQMQDLGNKQFYTAISGYGKSAENVSRTLETK